MKTIINTYRLSGIVLITSVSLGLSPAQAAGNGWSVAPYFGLSQLGNQSPDFAGADNITDGRSDISVDQGFTAGLGFRYDYQNSRWTSELGWEYRSNDSDITTSDGIPLPAGNYASNTFYLNGRYALSEGNRLTPWVGGGLNWIQEIDLDSVSADGERSFSDSGSVGLQVMAGVDYDISERFYLSTELRYSNQSGLDLNEEGGNGRVIGINYQTVTVGVGIGFRF